MDTAERTIVVGDVHGCLDELQRLMEQVGYDPTADRLVMVGDLVAKGPDSQGVIQYLREANADSVMGNHDAALLKWLDGKELKKSHSTVAGTLKKADWTWLDELPLYLKLKDHHLVVVHGGLMPDVKLKKQKRENLLNLRSIDAEGEPSARVDGGAPWASLWKGPDTVVFGHDALRGLQQWDHALGLDTGCVYGHRLTGAVFPGGKLVSVPARRAYTGLD